MTQRKLRFPMFLKFLIGCLTLAGLLIIGGTLVVQKETRQRSRGSFLERAIKRYVAYQERVGQGMTGTLEIVAGEPVLREVVIAAAAPAAEDPAAPPRAVDPVKVAEDAYKRLSTKNGIRPDVFAVFTATNRVIWTPQGSPLRAEAMPELAVIEKVRTGSVFAHKLQLIDGVPYQVSALPLRDDGDQVVGGVLVGVKLDRIFEEFSAQSDDDRDLRMRPTLLDGATVLATAWPDDHRDGLGRAMQPDKIERIKVGQDVRDVIRVKGGAHDIAAAELDGYRGLDSTTIGRLTMTRSRTLTGQGSKIPWTEIAVGVVLSLLISFLMAFWITRPIKQFVAQSRRLLDGETDLTQRIAVNSRDETADLAENINQVFARLQHLASDVQGAAFQVGASSAEISAASKQTLAGLKDQTLKIEGSTAAITELSASIQQVAGNAAQASEVAEQTNVAVGSAVQRMQEVRTSVEDAAEKMRELGESSKRIGNIVEVIRQISEQTSMLALNASIEAAHAGEQGRGFAVVADEVSSLARRVGQSAKDIEALIQTIKEQTQAAVASMETGTEEVENGSQLVTSTLTGLGELIGVVKDTAHAVQEQAVVSDEIARNMDAVQQIASEVLSGSEESVVQAERLHELAYQLEESIGGFNLDGSGAAAAVGPRRDDPPPRPLPARAVRPLPAPRVRVATHKKAGGRTEVGN
jgi:methyl-accepting chemotaxis protein